MGEGGDVGATWQDKLLERCEWRVQLIQRLFEARDLCILQNRAIGNAKFSSQIEQLVLDRGEHRLNQRRELMGAEQTQKAV